MDLVLDEVVGPSEKLSGEQDDRRRAVSDLLVLLLGERYKNTSLKSTSMQVSTLQVASERWIERPGDGTGWRAEEGDDTYSRVGHLEQVEDSSSIVGDGHILVMRRDA